MFFFRTGRRVFFPICKFDFGKSAKIFVGFQTLVSCANEICIILTMDKEAKKRIKDAIEKKNQARQQGLKERSSPPTQTKQRPGHTVRPEKKRG